MTEEDTFNALRRPSIKDLVKLWPKETCTLDHFFYKHGYTRDDIIYINAKGVPKWRPEVEQEIDETFNLYT